MKSKKVKISVFWFRRDLRLEDNVGLFEALSQSDNVLPIFIFDDSILKELPKDDARVSFIYDRLHSIHQSLVEVGSGLQVLHGNVLEVWQQLIQDFEVKAVFTNKDYEPYAIQRDKTVAELLAANGIAFNCFKDQVIFEEHEVTKDDGKPYTVYTPFKNKWLSKMKTIDVQIAPSVDLKANFLKYETKFPRLADIGFERSEIKVRDFTLDMVEQYHEVRDFPDQDATSYLSPYLRFGSVSVRQIYLKTVELNPVFVSELIWREFFMQILFHFPKVVNSNFKSKYDAVPWRNNKAEFELWKAGQTGYPMVDAGMRQLNQTGYMHNRVRMITAGFLCKHLLIDWRWGEAYFAEKLLDYDLSANNGNWQWAAGTGCDAAPYFRVFNPTTQIKKFDPEFKYIRKFVPEFEGFSYPKPMVEHKMARERAIETYKMALNG